MASIINQDINTPQKLKDEIKLDMSFAVLLKEGQAKELKDTVIIFNGT